MKTIFRPLATWYAIYAYSSPPSLKPVKVVSRTDNYITVLENWQQSVVEVRRAIDNNVFATLEAAEAEVLKRLEERIEHAKSDLLRDEAALEKWKKQKSHMYGENK